MAAVLDYDGTPNGVLLPIAEIVQRIHLQYYRAHTEFVQELADVVDAFSSADDQDNRNLCIQQASGHNNDLRVQCVESIRRFGRMIETRLLDRATVLVPLRSGNDNIYTVLRLLHRDMFNGPESIKANVFSIGSVTAGTNNTGNGSIFADLTLDAYSNPCQRYPANPLYRGVTSELVIPETVTVTCIVDAYGQVLPEFQGVYNGRLIEPNYIAGNEQFCVCGNIPSAGRVSSGQYGSGFGVDDNEGSGPGPIFYGMDANLGTPDTQLISNNSFEFGSSNEPTNWGADSAGVAATNVFLNTGEFFQGAQSLNFRGAGGTATIRRAQSMDNQYLTGGKKYVLSCWIKSSAPVAAGDVTICFYASSGYTATSSEKISIAAASLPSDWTFYKFHVVMPSPIPSDFKLKIEVTGTLTATENIYFDQINLKAAEWSGGFSVQAYNGSTPPRVGDVWSFPITQSETGIFQTFCRRWWGVQLPSKSDDTETIDDSLFGPSVSMIFYSG